MNQPLRTISAEMTLLDILSEYPATEAVFRAYDRELGTCLCCTMLFESLATVAQRHSMQLEELLCRLNRTTRAEADAAPTDAPHKGPASDPVA